MSLFVRLVIMVALFITINKNFDLVLEPVCLAFDNGVFKLMGFCIGEF